MKQDFFTVNLPSEIILNILLRLPLQTIAISKCVCKQWLDLLETDEFINSHLSKSTPTLAVFQIQHTQSCYKIYEFEDHPNLRPHELHYNLVTTFKLPFTGMMHGSDNGFLLLRDERYSRLFVCNPITREYVQIPTPLEFDYRYPQVATFGFGACRKTGLHKVVRVFHDCLLDPDTHALVGIPKPECHVYTLGTGSWRSTTPSAPLEYNSRSYGTLLHGNLHWLVRDLNRKPWISCMDLETELFTTISPPPPFVERLSFTCGVSALSDRLCICCNNSSEKEIIVWLMMEYGNEESWSRIFVIRNSGDLAGEFFDVARPIKVFQNGDVLMAWGDSTLFYSSSKKRTIKKIGIFEPRRCASVDSILHTSSFVSLKTLGGVEKVYCF